MSCDVFVVVFAEHANLRSRKRKNSENSGDLGQSSCIEVGFSHSRRWTLLIFDRSECPGGRPNGDGEGEQASRPANG